MEAHDIARRLGIAVVLAAGLLLGVPAVAQGAAESGARSPTASAAKGGATEMSMWGANPHGWLDTVDGGGVAHGWTCDPDDFSQPLQVHFYVDGPAGSGTFIGATSANITRESAVGDACGGWRNHGYRWGLPSWLWDGHWHTLYVHAINVGPGDNVLLQGSGTWFRLGGASPHGWLDRVDEDGVAHGWTCDPDDYGRPLTVHFYVDGTFVGHVQAGATREAAVGDLCGGTRNHGYSFILPESVRDSQWRSLSAWALNVGGGSNAQLSGSPKAFRLDPSLEPEAFKWEAWGIDADPSSEGSEARDGSAAATTEGASGAPAPVEAASNDSTPGPTTELEAATPEEDGGAEGPEAGPRAGASAARGTADAAGVSDDDLAGPAAEDAEQAPTRADALEPEEPDAPSSVDTTSTTRCEWHTFSATFRQTRHGWRVLTYKGTFRVCYVPNDRIVSVTSMQGDATEVCSWCGWRWLGNANGYPTYLNYGSRVVLKYRGTAQFCPPHFWCIGTRQPWIDVTFFPNGTKKQVTGVV